MIKTKSKKTTATKRTKDQKRPLFQNNSYYNSEEESNENTGITGLYHPSESDIMDELSRLDSYQYGKYNG